MVIFKNFFGTNQQSEIMTSALDLAKTAASFASNPSDIASLTHEIDLIASQQTPSTLLSPEDETSLFNIYLKIEQYLLTSDPIRTYNKDELRSKASRGLRSRLEAYENQANFKKQVVNV